MAAPPQRRLSVKERIAAVEQKAKASDKTLFLDQFGDPAAWYRTDPKTGSVRVERKGLGWGRAVGRCSPLVGP